MDDLGKIGGMVPTDPRVDALHLATAVVRYGHGPRRVASQLRQQGPGAAYSVYEQLTDEQRTHVDHEARALAAAGVEAVLLGQNRYPQLLACLRQAPAALFC